MQCSDWFLLGATIRYAGSAINPVDSKFGIVCLGSRYLHSSVRAMLVLKPEGFTSCHMHVDKVTLLLTLLKCVMVLTGETDGSLRLEGGAGANNNTGRLEIFLDGRWGTVCRDSFGQVEGILACNQLGYASLLDSFTAEKLG